MSKLDKVFFWAGVILLPVAFVGCLLIRIFLSDDWGWVAFALGVAAIFAGIICWRLELWVFNFDPVPVLVVLGSACIASPFIVSWKECDWLARTIGVIFSILPVLFVGMLIKEFVESFIWRIRHRLSH